MGLVTYLSSSNDTRVNYGEPIPTNDFLLLKQIIDPVSPPLSDPQCFTYLAFRMLQNLALQWVRTVVGAVTNSHTISVHTSIKALNFLELLGKSMVGSPQELGFLCPY